ncbi:MAG: T9SS type A sorting domain-containing protein [Flavobacteriales bacterium]|nr:T9SS type A sorting domain-containing protein [Flavobacteriales bacterium]
MNATISYFEIYDSKGSVVLKNKNLNSNSIEVTNLTPGVYFLKVIDDKNQIKNVRFVKK